MITSEFWPWKMPKYTKLAGHNIKQFLNSFDLVLTDCDGTFIFQS